MAEITGRFNKATPSASEKTAGALHTTTSVAQEGVKPVASPIIQADTSKLRGTPLNNADSIACNWEVKKAGEGQITARSNISGTTFEGTIKDFYKFLRGELETEIVPKT